MIGAVKQADGTIVAPATFTYTDDALGEVTGEGQVELKPGDPDYDVWDEWLSSQ